MGLLAPAFLVSSALLTIPLLPALVASTITRARDGDKMTLSRQQAYLRRYDRALRLRVSHEQQETVLVERKTFCGKYGTMAPGSVLWSPDTGRRKEEGHVAVASIQVQCFNLQDLVDSLREADTWQRWNRDYKPLWQRVEEREARAKLDRRIDRQEELRYRASQLFDRYVWKHKQRIRVPESIR